MLDGFSKIFLEDHLDLDNQLIKYNALCGTAWAAPGLSNINTRNREMERYYEIISMIEETGMQRIVQHHQANRDQTNAKKIKKNTK